MVQGRVREILKNQGHGTVREFYVVSGKNEFLFRFQGNIREFYNFQFVSAGDKQNMANPVFLAFMIQA